MINELQMEQTKSKSKQRKTQVSRSQSVLACSIYYSVTALFFLALLFIRVGRVEDRRNCGEKWFLF